MVEHLDAGCLRIRRWGDIADGTLPPTFYKVFRKGQILYPTRNPHLCRAAAADFDGICGEKTLTLSVRDGVDPRFMPFVFQSEAFITFATNRKIGSTNPHVRWRDVADFGLDLPPLDQQRRIAEILWSVDETLQRYKELNQSTTEAREAYLRDIFTNGRAAAANGHRDAWPHWNDLELAELVEFLDGQRKPIKEADRAKRRGEYPYYGASGIIDTIDDYIFNEPLILLGEDGANIVDRSTRLAFRVDGKIWVNNHAHVMRVKAPHSRVYLEYFLESLDYKLFVTGTAQPKLNKGVCQKLRVPVPDAQFQGEVEQRLLGFEATLTAQGNSEKSLRGLLFALLNQFT